MEKICSRCGILKDVTKFYKMKSSHDGYRPECSECHKKDRKLRAMEDPVMDRCKRMGYSIINRTVSNIDKPKNKVYRELGIVSEIGDTGKEIGQYLYENFYDDVKALIDKGETPTIDRIDPTKNYSTDNIRIISFRENSLAGAKEGVRVNSKRVLVEYPDGKARVFESVSAVSREIGKKRETIIRNRDNQTATRDGYMFTDYNKFMEDKKENDNMKLKVVTQDVCPSCSVLKNYLDNEHGDTEVEYINISQHPELIEELGVNATPTTLLWDDDFGEPVSRFVGFEAGKDEEHIDDIVWFVE